GEPTEPPYRRLIEVEWMTITGGDYKRQDNAYCSNGAAVAFQSSAAGTIQDGLTMPLERTLPAGRYLVWVQCYLDAAEARQGEPINVRATLGDTAQEDSV